MKPSTSWANSPAILLILLSFACLGRIAYVRAAEVKRYGKYSACDIQKKSVDLLSRLNVPTNGLTASAARFEDMSRRGRTAPLWMVDCEDTRGREITISWDANTGGLVSVSNRDSVLDFTREPITDSETALKLATEWRSRLGMRGADIGQPTSIGECVTGWLISWRHEPECIIRLDKQRGTLSYALAMPQ